MLSLLWALIRTSVGFAWSLYSWFVYKWLTVLEMEAIFTGRPRLLRAHHGLNAFLIFFQLTRAIVAVSAFNLPPLWTIYIKIDKLFILFMVEKQIDYFSCIMGLFFLIYLAFTYTSLYVGSTQTPCHAIMFDLLVNVYEKKRKSAFFPEIGNLRICQQIGIIMTTMKLAYLFVFAVIALTSLSFILHFTKLYGASVYSPQLIIDATLVIYFAVAMFHFHIFVAYTVLIFVNILSMAHQEHTLAINRILHSTFHPRGLTWNTLANQLSARLFISNRLAYHQRNLAYVNRCNGFIRVMGASYTLMNLVNPSCMLCYVIMKKAFFTLPQFASFVTFLSALLTGVPLLYYVLSLVNQKLTKSPRKLIHTIQHTFRGKRHLRFKVFILSYYECISGKRAPGFAIGVSSSASKMKAFRMILTGAAYFLMIWNNFIQYYKK